MATMIPYTAYCDVSGCTSRAQWQIVRKDGSATVACSRRAQRVLRDEQAKETPLKQARS